MSILDYVLLTIWFMPIACILVIYIKNLVRNPLVPSKVAEGTDHDIAIRCESESILFPNLSTLYNEDWQLLTEQQNVDISEETISQLLKNEEKFLPEEATFYLN